MKLNEQTYRIKQMMGVVNEGSSNPALIMVRRRLGMIDNVIKQFREDYSYTKCDMKWGEYWGELESEVTYAFYHEVLEFNLENKAWEEISDFVLDFLKQNYHNKLKELFEVECG